MLVNYCDCMKLSFTKLYKKNINDAISLKKKISNIKFEKKIFLIVETVTNILNNGGKIILCGNGGSAADAQHLATELTVRFKKNRKALPSIALTTDTSALTAIGNDYGFKYICSNKFGRH